MDKRKLQQTRFDKYCDSLRLLGYPDYKAYLASEHWRQFNDWYRSTRELPQKCLVCRSPHAELHHVDYRNIGHENLWDVVPLCREHHEMLHKWLAENNLPFHRFRLHLIQCFKFTKEQATGTLKPFKQLRAKAFSLKHRRESRQPKHKVGGRSAVRLVGESSICDECHEKPTRKRYGGRNLCARCWKVANGLPVPNRKPKREKRGHSVKERFLI